MKGIQGLIIAIVLGVLGALVNLYYLTKGRDTKFVHFIGVRDGAKISVGQPFAGEQLESVAIPSEHAGDLRKYAIPHSEIDSVVGWKSRRAFDGQRGQLLLRTDVRTPTELLNLKENQAAISVLVNPATTISSQIIPEVTPVSFYLPVDRTAVGGSGAWEWYGPFEVLAVGGRLGRTADSGRRSGAQQKPNVLTLRVWFKEGRIDAKIAELKDYLRRTANEPLDVMIHPPARPVR
jgi:hypothetical protein